MKLRTACLFALMASAVAGGARAAVECRPYYTKCNDGSTPVNGVCGCIATSTSDGKCMIAIGTELSDNAGTVGIYVNIYQE